MRGRWTIALGALAAAAGSGASAGTMPSCPLIGAVYGAGSDRLTIATMPPGSIGSAIYTLWRFRQHDAQGRLRGELRMRYGCGNGRAPCFAAPESRPDPDDGYFSEVVQLNRDFTQALGRGAPYAYVLPGFVTIDWQDAAADLSRDIVAPRHRAWAPDFDNRVVWRRLRCGPPEGRRGR